MIKRIGFIVFSTLCLFGSSLSSISYTIYVQAKDNEIASGPFTQIAAGAAHTCALTASGAVQCWGDNYVGQLGDGTIEKKSSLTNVIGLSQGVVSISLGRLHSCAIMQDGSVKCWGKNTYGQLGDGTATDRLTPVQVTGLNSSVKSLATGTAHTCAVLNDGNVKCWGSNSHGQLGISASNDQLAPVNVPGVGSMANIGAGFAHTCAVNNAGAVTCWGKNTQGQLGNDSTVDSKTPVAVIGLSSGVTKIAVGALHNCVLQNGKVLCWGYNLGWQLGDGSNFDHTTPVAVVDVNENVNLLSVGDFFGCVLLVSGKLQCWGTNDYGQLGDGTFLFRSRATDVTILNGAVKYLTAGSEHVCVILPDNQHKCWGNNTDGQLGTGTAEPLSPNQFRPKWNSYVPMVTINLRTN